MLMREGVSGYGIYWMLLEMLRDSKDYKMFYFPESFAYALHVQDVAQVERVCKEYGLFTFDKDDYMSSAWLLEAMGEYDDRKAKLREAGRRGAARRWASPSTTDGEAIATPSTSDGEAKAHNVTLPNVIERNITLPTEQAGRAVDEELVNTLAATSPEGHAPGYIAQVCLYYGMKEETLNALCGATNNADITNPTYKNFCALVKRIQGEKWVPKHPDAFFLAKLVK